MRLPIPGPLDVARAAASLRDAVTAALELVPRLRLLVDRVDDLIGRVDRVLDSVELTVGRVDAVIDHAAVTQRRADDAVAGAQGTVNRIDPLLSAYEPSLRTLAPVLQRLAQSTSAEEVDAAVHLVDRLPRLIAHVDDDLLPLLSTLDRVGPDLHELLEVTQDLRRVITGLPGIGFLRRRGEDELPSEGESG